MSISAISGSSPYLPVTPTQAVQGGASAKVDKDHDGDNDASESKAAAAAEASKSTGILDIKA